MTTTAMMNTTMLYVIMMVEHVVTTKMTDGIPIAQNVNATLVSRQSLACTAILASAQTIKLLTKYTFSLVHKKFN